MTFPTICHRLSLAARNAVAFFAVVLLLCIQSGVLSFLPVIHWHGFMPHKHTLGGMAHDHGGDGVSKTGHTHTHGGSEHHHAENGTGADDPWRQFHNQYAAWFEYPQSQSATPADSEEQPVNEPCEDNEEQPYKAGYYCQLQFMYDNAPGLEIDLNVPQIRLLNAVYLSVSLPKVCKTRITRGPPQLSAA